MTDEQKKIDRLYEVLENLEKKGDTEHSSAVKWAIYYLEMAVNG